MNRKISLSLLVSAMLFGVLTPTSASANPITPAGELSDPALCKIEQHPDKLWTTRSGFPQHPDYLISDNKLNVQLIYVDATDLTSRVTPSRDARFWINGVGRFLNDMAEGRVTFSFNFENKYFRLPKPITSYGITREKQGDTVAFVQAAIDVADKEIDFTNVDFVIVILPPNVTAKQVDYSPAIPLEKAFPFRTDEGLVYRATLAGQDTRWPEGHTLISHEMGHLLGLQDFYWYGWKPGMPYEQQFKFMGHFDNMNFAPGKAREWTAWNRWLLGFLADAQVRCITNQVSTIHELTSVSTRSSNPKLIVIPLSKYSAIVVESRRKARHDNQTLAKNNGLLVYRVDTSKDSGFGPIEILRNPSSRDPYFADATLTRGEVLTIGKVTIKNLRVNRNSDLVEVTIKQN